MHLTKLKVSLNFQPIIYFECECVSLFPPHLKCCTVVVEQIQSESKCMCKLVDLTPAVEAKADLDNKQNGNRIDSKSFCAQNDIMIIEKAEIKGPIETLFGIFFSCFSRMRERMRDCEKQPSIILKINSISTICLIIYSLHQIIRFYNNG